MSTDKKELRAQLARAKDAAREAVGRVHDTKVALDAAEQWLAHHNAEAARIECELARLEPLGKLAVKAMQTAAVKGHLYVWDSRRLGGVQDKNTARELERLGFFSVGDRDAWGLRYVLTDLGRAKLAEVKP